MKPIALSQVRLLVGGKALNPTPADSPDIKSICTDSRRIEPGCLFVAIRGENFDGAAFLPQVAAGGALAALVESDPPTLLPNLPTFHVSSTRGALGKLARAVRGGFRAKVIAVGGSNGKTTTKHLIDAALCRKLRGSTSPKSFNNDIGVPVTIFAADPMQDYLVLEMGTNHHGELQPLSEMATPDVAVITNVSAEHLEGLGDLMGVRQEEASIVAGLKRDGLLVVNGDDPELLEAVSGYGGRKITFGFKPSNDLFASDIYNDFTGTRFQLNNSRRTVFVPLLGKHTACNALAAIAVGRRMGLDEEQIIESLSIARGPEMRLQLVQFEDLTVLNDAYNANPASVRAALETLTTLPTGGRRIAVLGDMRELGEASDRYHRDIGQYVATLPVDELICVGEQSRLIAQAASASGYLAPISHYPDSQSAARNIPSHLQDSDLLLLKASRGIALERVAEAIAASRGRTFRAIAG